MKKFQFRSLPLTVILLVCMATSLIATPAMAVTWLHYKMDATGSWWGGDPINGYDSFTYSFAEDTSTPTHYYGSAGLPVRVSMAIEDNLVDNPSGSTDYLFQKFGFFYNPNLGSGLDTSTHYFTYSRTVEMVFSTPGCTLFKLDYMPQADANATVVVEQGVYINGIFTPTGQVMDFVTTSAVDIGPGVYRIRTVFDSGVFSSNMSVERYANSNLTMLFLNEVTNRSPIANAGPDLSVNCCSNATLDGSASSDPDGDTLTYEWYEGTTLLSNAVSPTLALSAGTHTLTLKVTDPSGASSSDTVQVTVEAIGFEGFLEPIGGADATGGSYASPLLTRKLGSAIPVKFRGSCCGNDVLIGIHTLQAIKYTSATASEAPINATSTDAATIGNQFRLTGNQWHFNLDTSFLSEGTWKLVATLSDGSTHFVWITLKYTPK